MRKAASIVITSLSLLVLSLIIAFAQKYSEFIPSFYLMWVRPILITAFGMFILKFVNKKCSIIFGLGMALLILFMFAFLIAAFPTSKRYVNKLDSVKAGMGKEEVIKILGRPEKIITRAEMPEIKGKEGTAENKNICLVYHNYLNKWFGAKIIYYFLIDETGKVSFVTKVGDY